MASRLRDKARGLPMAAAREVDRLRPRQQKRRRKLLFAALPIAGVAAFAFMRSRHRKRQEEWPQEAAMWQRDPRQTDVTPVTNGTTARPVSSGNSASPGAT